MIGAMFGAMTDIRNIITAIVERFNISTTDYVLSCQWLLMSSCITMSDSCTLCAVCRHILYSMNVFLSSCICSTIFLYVLYVFYACHFLYVLYNIMYACMEIQYTCIVIYSYVFRDLCRYQWYHATTNYVCYVCCMLCMLCMLCIQFFLIFFS